MIVETRKNHLFCDMAKVQLKELESTLQRVNSLKDENLLPLYRELDPAIDAEIKSFETQWLPKAKEVVNLLLDKLKQVLLTSESLSVRELVQAVEILVRQINLAEGRATQLIGVAKVNVPLPEIDKSIRELEHRIKELESQDIKELEPFIDDQ